MERFDDDCNGGQLDANNTITLCNCRDEKNKPLDFHGWHCEIKNNCDEERIPKYHKPSETEKVGKPYCDYRCPEHCENCHGFINGKLIFSQEYVCHLAYDISVTDDTDDMYCDECKGSYVNPDLYCIHQCDGEHPCFNGGECAVVDEVTGVSK